MVTTKKVQKKASAKKPKPKKLKTTAVVHKPASALPASLQDFKIEKIEIQAASIKDGILNVAYSKYFMGLPEPIESIESSPNKVHADLLGRFELLKPHFAAIADYKDWGKDIDPTEPPKELMERIKVIGYHISGSAETRAIKITGQKRKLNNQVVCLNTPLQKFEDNAFPYEHAEHLKDVIAGIEQEIILCLGGKYAPIPTLFDEQEDAEESNTIGEIGEGEE